MKGHEGNFNNFICCTSLEGREFACLCVQVGVGLALPSIGKQPRKKAKSQRSGDYQMVEKEEIQNN